MALKLPKDFASYKPKVTFRIEEGDYIIKIAETKEELLGAFHLRHNVFYKERKGVCLPSQISTDEFDVYGDHLIIINKDKQEVVGTYRLTLFQGTNQEDIKNACRGMSKYFEIMPFIKAIKNHNVVEMEWACTDKHIRPSRAIHYLWIGMARYFRITFSKYLCGRVDLLKSTPEESAVIYQTFIQQKMTHCEEGQNTPLQPVPIYSIKDFDKMLSQARPDKKCLSKLSRLFLWYFKMGAKVHGPPIFDPKGHTYDFFMSLDFKKIQNPDLLSRYEDAVWLKNKLPD